ncbi:MAG: ATP synthase F1 subunit gamma [Bacteroidales bacterium]
MATLRDLKVRIGSVSSTGKITGAMKMISSAKMRKAEMRLKRLVPYRNQIELIIRNLLSSDCEFNSPLITERAVTSVAMVVFGSDDGLCGAYNIQVLKRLNLALEDIKTQYGKDTKITIFPVGRKMLKGAKQVKFSNVTVASEALINTRSTAEEIKQFTANVENGFVKGEFDKVELLYTHFQSASRQSVQMDTLFPVSMEALIASAGVGGKVDENRPYLFEPDASTIFNSVLPLYILSVMQEVAGENSASEQAARVIAMQTANDNANKLLESLQLEYNKLRQENITTELLDIVGGQVK